MHPAKHTILLLLTIVTTYLWLTHTFLKDYSLQLFALLIFLFLIIKRTKNAKIWYILPDKISAEMALLTGGFLLLIGATGNLSSIFFPLTYVHLFFLVLASHPITTAFTTIGVLWFHYSLTPNLLPEDISVLTTLPLLWLIFMFAKHEYDETQVQKHIIETEEIQLERLSGAEQTLEKFMTQFLQPKLNLIEEELNKREKSKDSDKDESAITLKDVSIQLSLLKNEVSKIIESIRK